MDYEIGHVNISNNITLSNIAEVGKRSQKKPTETTFGVPEIKRTKSLGVIAKDLLVQWHKDAYPFVCILSLSCPSNFSYPRGSSGSSASGGQTILQTAHNPPEYMTIPPPQFGQAVILQGRYITHAALPPADKNAERITMATSFRPLNSLLRQDCVLDTVKPNSDRKQLFTEYFAYRADLLKEKVDDIVARIREQRDCGDIVGKGEMARWSRDVLAHVQDMMEQVNDGEDLV